MVYLIQYAPKDTLKYRWFWFKSTIMKLMITYGTVNNRKLSCYALSRHPSDNHLFDDNIRWWLLWHEYVLDKRNIPVYCARWLLGPNQISNIKKYLLWTNFVHLTNSSCYIHGPFNFAFRSDIINPNQCIALSHCEFFLTSCSILSIIPSILSIIIIDESSWEPQKKKP